MNLRYSIENGYSVTEPKRGTKESAGIDIFIPFHTPKFLEDFEKFPIVNTGIEWAGDKSFFIVPAGGSVLIPTGLRFEIPQNTYLEVANRSGVASKRRLIYGAHIIDSDYRGIVFINILNISNKDATLELGTAIAQIIHKTYLPSELEKVEAISLDTERGEGALGSTHK